MWCINDFRLKGYIFHMFLFISWELSVPSWSNITDILWKWKHWISVANLCVSIFLFPMTTKKSQKLMSIPNVGLSWHTVYTEPVMQEGFSWNSICICNHLHVLFTGLVYTGGTTYAVRGLGRLILWGLEKNGCHFADHAFNLFFTYETCSLVIQISLKFVTCGPIHNKPALV